ncbi:condensin-2 complex subunit H2 isoform X2 [Eurytemora carolleeae]|uniref:condensin-2 complex subunit H2 isoform X2 n=1 Tax=Eurytemora carolleeae TaxID=1294199 RepID=UPI000C757BC4|nr:condensin-2 complex subunit H2 isoform X2 [Eurytemora carolleeae]|eukprot:XP_023323551.1 condensin-2 complex subunit H2-like isoform X2 [Eurytemora affinis]
MSQIHPDDDSESILDPRFEELLKPIRDVQQNFQIQVSELLAKYLDKVQTINVNGQTLNFTEAAMLLQGSASCYSKKVDYLHQSSMRMLDLITKDNANDDEGGGDGEGTDNSSKKRRGGVDANLEFKLIHLELAKNIDCKEGDVDLRSLEDKLGFIQVTPREFIEKEGQDPSILKVDLYYGPNFELLGAKKDFKMNSQFSTATGMLGETLETNTDANICDETVLNPDFRDESVDDGCHDNGVDEDVDAPADPGGDHVNDGSIHQELEYSLHIEHGGSPELPEDQLDISERVEGQVVCTRNKEILADRLPTPPPPCVPEKDPWEPCNPFQTTGTVKEIKRGRVFKIPGRISGKLKEKENMVPSVAEFLQFEGVVKSKHAEINDYILAEEERRKKFIKSKMKRGRTVADRGLEGVVGEENAEEPREDGLDDEVQDDDVPDEYDEDQDFLPLPEFEFPENPHMGGTVGPALDLESQSSSQGKKESYEDLVIRIVAEIVHKSQAGVSSTEMMKKVITWHDMISPRLEKVEKMAAFDIHLYGSKILEQFPSENRKTTISFRDVVRGKSREDTCRYFLSSLMLANCSNIEIGSEGVMDDMKLRFLSSRRHHEDLEGFQAASQATPNDSLSSSSKRPRL